MSLAGKDLISILDLNRSLVESLFRTADEMLVSLKKRTRLHILRNRIAALLFLEPSTRTMHSFQAAVYRLGGEAIVFTGDKATSLAKGENYADTIRMLDSYSDIIIIRSKYEGAARFASEIAEHPVINAGDGGHEHPTQTLIDLYTMYKLFGGIDGLHIGILGDLKYARTITSLLLGLTFFKPGRLVLISPGTLTLRKPVAEKISMLGLDYEEETDIRRVIGDLDVLYVTRIQRERYPDPLEYERFKNLYRITLELLKNAKKDLKILHPLPKIDEIDHRVDDTEHAAYFYQASLAVPVRMALLKHVLAG